MGDEVHSARDFLGEDGLRIACVSCGLQYSLYATQGGGGSHQSAGCHTGILT